MVKIIITKKVAATYKYVLYFHMEIYISLRQKSIQSLSYFILLLLISFPVHLCIIASLIKWQIVCTSE